MARSKATKMVYKNSRKHRGMGSIIKHTKNPGVNNEKIASFSGGAVTI